MSEMKVGDWAVWRAPYDRIQIGDVRRVTAQCFWSKSEWSSRDHRYDRRGVVFCGSQDAAERLHAQLTSSAAQQNEDNRNARARREDRDQRFIAAALSAPKHGVEK